MVTFRKDPCQAHARRSPSKFWRRQSHHGESRVMAVGSVAWPNPVRLAWSCRVGVKAPARRCTGTRANPGTSVVPSFSPPWYCTVCCRRCCGRWQLCWRHCLNLSRCGVLRPVPGVIAICRWSDLSATADRLCQPARQACRFRAMPWRRRSSAGGACATMSVRAAGFMPCRHRTDDRRQVD